MTAVIIVAIVGILAFAVYSIVTGGKSKKEKEASKKDLVGKILQGRFFVLVFLDCCLSCCQSCNRNTEG